MAETVAAALIEAGVSAGVASAVGTAVAWVGSAAVSYGLSQALAKKPRSADPNTLLGSTTVSAREAASPRQIIYGETRVGGTIVYMNTTEANLYLHLVIAMSGHTVDSIGDVWINDVPITAGQLDGFGDVNAGPYYNPALYYPQVTERLPVEGRYIYLSRAPNAIVSVNVVSGENYFNLTADASLSGKTIDLGAATYDAYTAEVSYTYPNPQSYVRVKKYDGTQLAADAQLVADAGEWTTNHKLRGCAYLYVRLLWDRKVWPNGLPNISAVVKGRKVYDPRSGFTVWSNNPALCLADYLTTSVGLGLNYATRIDEASLIAAANACDETVSLDAGGTEKRYTCNGAFRADETPKAIIEAIAGSMAGYAIRIGAQWRILAGVYPTPTITLDASMMVGPMSVQTRLSRRDVFSAVKGTFASPATKYQPDDFPPITSSAYDSEDGGRVWGDLALRCTQSASMAQRIARIALRRARQQITVTAPFALPAFRVQPGDTVNLTIARMGWSAKPFTVQGSKFKYETDGVLAVELTLRETASAIYDWTPADDEAGYDPAPNTDLDLPTLALADFGIGLNLIANSAPTDSVAGWRYYGDYGTGGSAHASFRYSPFADGNAGVVLIEQPDTALADVYMYAVTPEPRASTNKNIPVVGGQRYQLSAYVNTNNARALLYVDWFDIDGVAIESSPTIEVRNLQLGSVPLTEYVRPHIFIDAPANAHYATPVLAKAGTKAGQSASYAAFARIFFGPATPTQNVPSAWVGSFGWRGIADTGVLAPDAATKVYSVSTGSTTTLANGTNPFVRALPPGTLITSVDFTATVTGTQLITATVPLNNLTNNSASVDITLWNESGGVLVVGGTGAQTITALGQMTMSVNGTIATVAGNTYTISVRGQSYGSLGTQVNAQIGTFLQVEEIRR